jgi:uncharacterized membrane protein YdjX (TVP38/TMEM64 family)
MPAPAATRRRAIIKAATFLSFIIAALLLVRQPLVKQFLTAEHLGRLLDGAGLWAPVLFMAIYCAAVCLLVPGSVMTAVGAVLFGAYWGFIYVFLGAMAGAVLAFLIGRHLGRDFAASLIGERLRKYDEAIERNGFATVLYLRLIYFPYTPMNFGMGLTRVRFRDYVAGSALGMLVGTFVLTFLFGTLREVWAGGQWAQLLQWKVFLAVALFALSLLVPKVVNRLRG